MEKQKEVKCKNCSGSGKVEFDSYSLSNPLKKPKTSIEKCKRCKGTGVAQWLQVYSEY